MGSVSLIDPVLLMLIFEILNNYNSAFFLLGNKLMTSHYLNQWLCDSLRKGIIAWICINLFTFVMSQQCVMTSQDLDACCIIFWTFFKCSNGHRSEINLSGKLWLQAFKWQSLQWCHNGHQSVSIHQPHQCLLNRLLRRKSKKTSKLSVTGLCAGNSPGAGWFPTQMASNVENVSIWWCHHDIADYLCISLTVHGVLSS